MKYLDVLNAVLRRLREEPVKGSDASEFAQLIRQFINETKEEIENAYEWNRLRHSIIITTAKDEDKYVAHCVDSRARVLEVYLDDGTPLRYGKWSTQNRLSLAHKDQTGKPQYIDRNGFDSTGSNIYQIWPKPDKDGYVITLNAVIPQDEYLNTDMDDAFVEIPTNPLILGAYLRAMEEEGDDATSRYEFNYRMYQDALHRAIAADESQHTDENIWELE